MLLNVTTAYCRQGRVNTWDVVNEAFCTDGSGSWTQSPILTLLGEGYVSEAFAAARQADPTCKLLYNDCTVASAGYVKVSHSWSYQKHNQYQCMRLVSHLLAVVR
jgi:GH35 family endo-1,4-beta-xylanase